MGNLAAFILSLGVPLVRKVLSALGIGFLTFSGLTLLFNQAQAGVLGSWAQLPPTMLSFLTISGFTEALGITLGALSARLALMVIGRMGRIGS